jgi:hypothetical protein
VSPEAVLEERCRMAMLEAGVDPDSIDFHVEWGGLVYWTTDDPDVDAVVMKAVTLADAATEGAA